MAEPITCPGCQRPLQVPESFHGQTVECPDCQHRFVAGAASSSEARVQTGAPLTVRPDAGAVEEPRPRRRFFDEDEDQDDRDLSVRRRHRRLTPHRGQMILTLGILSIFFIPLLLGTMAWIMGNADLKEMEEGRMDPEGESNTRTGKILGMVMVIINLVTLVLVFGFMCVMFGGMALVGVR